jgi:hypothetical protein
MPTVWHSAVFIQHQKRQSLVGCLAALILWLTLLNSLSPPSPLLGVVSATDDQRVQKKRGLPGSSTRPGACATRTGRSAGH